MKRLLLFPLVLPLAGIPYVVLSVAESFVAARFHWVSPIGWLNGWFVVSGGLTFGFFVVPLFVIWDLLRNKRRPLDLEDGLRQFFLHLLWALVYGTVASLLYIAIPDRFWDGLELFITSTLKVSLGHLDFDQGIAPYVVNAAAILFGASRFVLRSEPASPRLLWRTFRRSWHLVPSRA